MTTITRELMDFVNEATAHFKHYTSDHTYRDYKNEYIALRYKIDGSMHVFKLGEELALFHRWLDWQRDDSDYSEFNINDTVIFKPTSEGLDILCDENCMHNVKEDGIVEMQMWDFMYTFRNHMFIGRQTPIENNRIRIKRN